jgi:hypothetical protein
LRGKWKTITRTALLLTVLCVSAFSAFAVPAFAEPGDVWLNWVWEPATSGANGEHARWYSHFEQAEAQVQHSGNYACSNGWYGTKGSWVYGQDWCSSPGYILATPQLANPGVGAYPWVQVEGSADYTWAWAGYCTGC